MRKPSNMRALRDSIWNGLARSDELVGFSRLAGAGGNVVLMYHSVGDPTQFGNVSTERFRQDLRTFSQTFDVVDLPAVSNGDGSNRRLAITFDDGYENFHSEAYPILREFGAPATVFLNSSFIGGGRTEQIAGRHNVDRAAVEMMDTDQIRSLIDDDLIHIGNHTRSHVRLPDVESTERLRSEIIGGKEDLEAEFGIRISRFSFPHGLYDQESVDVVAQSHDYGLTSINRQITESVDHYRIPRIRGHNPRHLVEWELTGLSERFRELYGPD